MSNEPRLGALMGADLPNRAPRVVLLGFPSDEGVRIGGGRAGAATGPAAIRTWLARLTPDATHPELFADLVRRTDDRGDVEVTGNVERDQESLGNAVAEALDEGAFPIVLGGGHETAFGQFLGHVRRGKRRDLLNWDATPDVEEKREGRAHAGSPFRQAIEHPSGLAGRYVAAGLQPQAVAAEHVRWIRDHDGRVFWVHDLTRPTVTALYGELSHPVQVSFDLGAVDQAFAPGVSAPATGGLDPALWLLAARAAGRSPAVVSADVVELCPPHDRDDQTARLAALTVWHLLGGLAERLATG